MAQPRRAVQVLAAFARAVVVVAEEAMLRSGAARRVAARGAAGTNGRAAMGRQLSGQTPLAVGELPPELHFRVGGVPEGGTIKLPPLRGPPMLIHSKGLAALGGFITFLC